MAGWFRFRFPDRQSSVTQLKKGATSMDIIRRLLDVADQSYRSGRGRDSDFLTVEEYGLYLTRELNFSYAEPQVFRPEWERKIIHFGPGEPALSYLKITSKAGRFAKLRHSDFLGAILGTGLERRVIGDLFILADVCVAVVKNEAAVFLKNHLYKVGAAAVDLTVLDRPPELPATAQVTKEYVLSSLRLDRFIASVFRQGRNPAQKQIQEGLVLIDGRPEKSVHYEVEPGSTVTLRKSGKIYFDRIKGYSRSGSFIVIIRHFS